MIAWSQDVLLESRVWMVAVSDHSRDAAVRLRFAADPAAGERLELGPNRGELKVRVSPNPMVR